MGNECAREGPEINLWCHHRPQNICEYRLCPYRLSTWIDLLRPFCYWYIGRLRYERNLDRPADATSRHRRVLGNSRIRAQADYSDARGGDWPNVL